MFPRKKTALAAVPASELSDAEAMQARVPPADPLEALYEVKRRLDASQATYSAAIAKLRQHQSELDEARRVVAGEAAANAALADLEGRHLVDPASVTVEAIEEARAAAATARKDADVGRARVAALERAIAIVAPDVESKSAEPRALQQLLDEQSAVHLRSLQSQADARFDAAVDDVLECSAYWNAIQQLIERIEPGHPDVMKGGDFTGQRFTFAEDFPTGPDKTPFRGSDRRLPGCVLGYRSLFVERDAIEQQKARLRAALAAAGVNV